MPTPTIDNTKNSKVFLGLKLIGYVARINPIVTNSKPSKKPFRVVPIIFLVSTRKFQITTFSLRGIRKKE
jgi:hypothetical protein